MRHRLRVAGASGEIFTPAALREVHRLSSGIPRVINVCCDRALLGAYTQDTQEVTPALVRRAAGEVYGRRFTPLWLGWVGCVPRHSARRLPSRRSFVLAPAGGIPSSALHAAAQARAPAARLAPPSSPAAGPPRTGAGRRSRSTRCWPPTPPTPATRPHSDVCCRSGDRDDDDQDPCGQARKGGACLPGPARLVGTGSRAEPARHPHADG